VDNPLDDFRVVPVEVALFEVVPVEVVAIAERDGADASTGFKTL
jgi:hypothetical protein